MSERSGAEPGEGNGSFAHASEAEFARILEFYQVHWRYEPDVFPILWDLNGNVVESFAPDFYLPDFDIYVELTTLQQRLVRKKNRKVRRLRELYPHISIKLFYARDFRALMLKYGRARLIDELSGTTGQVGAHFTGDETGQRSETAGRRAVRTPIHTSPEPIAPATPPLSRYAAPIGRSRAARRRAARRTLGSPSHIER